jgi:endonuclease/exonuclease/phosphatase (EEP) superfamily protein YafD
MSQAGIKIGIVSILMLNLLSLLGFLNPWIDLLSHFRWQYTVLLAMSTLYAVFAKFKKLIWVLATCTLLNGACVAYLWLPESGEKSGINQPVQPVTLSILDMNLFFRNDNYAAIIKEIQQRNADVVVLEELTPDLFSHLEEALSSYPYQCTITRLDPFGIGIFSKKRFVRSVENPCHLPVCFVIQADIEVGSKVVSILAIHNLAPITVQSAGLNNQIASGVKAFAAAQKDRSIILIGDINSTPWSHLFWQLFSAANFKDSERGFGLQNSWTTSDAPMAIPIDHCFFTPDWRCAERRLGSNVGSDHYPLFVQLASGN